MTDDEIKNIDEASYDKEREKIGTVKANIQLSIVLGLIICGIIISQLLSGSADRIIEEKDKKDLLVNIITIEPQTTAVTYTSTGNIEVDGQINIVPQVSGRVVKISDNLNNGKTFDKDEILFQIEQVDFINHINIAKAQVEQARTALSIQQAESDAAIAEWKTLNPNSPAPDLVARIPQLKEAEANVLSARAQLEEARLDYNRSKFRYNFLGRIIDTSIELGQFLQAGQSYGTAYPVNALEVRIPVSDKLLPYINDQEGKNAEITTTYGGETLKINGVIDRFGSVVNQTTRFVDVIVKPQGENWDKLVPGVFVSVTFIGKEINNTWELPTETIQGQNKIWVVEDDNTLTEKELNIVSTKENTVLAIGDGSTVRVVTGLLKGASDGMKVRIKETNTNTLTLKSAPPEPMAEE